MVKNSYKVETIVCLSFLFQIRLCSKHLPIKSLVILDFCNFTGKIIGIVADRVPGSYSIQKKRQQEQAEPPFANNHEY